MQKIKLKRILELLEAVEPTIDDGTTDQDDIRAAIFLVKELLQDAK